MGQVQHIAFIGNSPPRRCGIATFTHDLHRAVATADSGLKSFVVAMTNPEFQYKYPRDVRFEVREDVIHDYVQAADFLNVADVDVVSLQHEFGIFGGDAGSYIVPLISRLEMPVVTTLHTVITDPTVQQRAVMEQIVDHSAKIVVMAEKGRDLLHSVYDIPEQTIEVIPHGIPNMPFLDPSFTKDKFGLEGKTVILTFGLLSPNKGIETMIEAMPHIIRACPNAVYVVLGATHPNLLRENGDAYRDKLVEQVHKLGIEDHVIFFNQFVELDKLLDFITMSDVYVTPYLNEAQITSGTLAYSFGLGKAVVSTPYWHARELLDEERGVIVPFGDAEKMGQEIAELLANDIRRHAMRKRAYLASRPMIWEQTAKRYLDVFNQIRNVRYPRRPVQLPTVKNWCDNQIYSAIPLDHLLSLCDDTGLLQHAVYSVPNRAHGYCIDDNARALFLSTMLDRNAETGLPDTIKANFSAFIQDAWNPRTQRFRNFMSYDRQWLEEAGSEDSHGRTLWALGECARSDMNSSRRRWASALFKAALPAVENFTSPRAWAFSLLGLDAYCTLFGGDLHADHIRRLLAEKLVTEFQSVNTEDWRWFEEVLAYDNARLPQALIQTGLATANSDYIDIGLRSLRWLTELQTAPSGCFRPVGTNSYGKKRQKPHAFDQQPLEASATISACLTARNADKDGNWGAEALRAFNWFSGDNDLRKMLIDPGTGACFDGLHVDRRNENQGAESVLSYLLGLTEIRDFVRTEEKKNARQEELDFGAHYSHNREQADTKPRHDNIYSLSG